MGRERFRGNNGYTGAHNRREKGNPLVFPVTLGASVAEAVRTFSKVTVLPNKVLDPAKDIFFIILGILVQLLL